MTPILTRLTRDRFRVVVVALLALLGYVVADGYRKGRDLQRVYALLGSHDATGREVGAERQAIDAICLGQKTDDDP